MDIDTLVQLVSGAGERTGPVLVHVVMEYREYWLEVTGVTPIVDTEPGWVNGAVIETRPISPLAGERLESRESSRHPEYRAAREPHYDTARERNGIFTLPEPPFPSHSTTNLP